MTWAKFDDGYFRNRKVRRVDSSAIFLHMTAIIHCAGSENDGVFDKADLALIAAEAKIPPGDVCAIAEKLVAERLFEDRGDTYVVHDFLDYNPSREECVQMRAENKLRASLRANAGLMGKIKARDKGRCRYCGRTVDWSNRRGSEGGTYDHILPVSKGGSNRLENIVVACRGCNSRKQDRTIEESGLALLPVVEPVVTWSPDPDPDPDPGSDQRSNKGMDSDSLPVTLPVGEETVSLRPRTPHGLIHCLRVAVERDQPRNGLWNPGGTFAHKEADGFLRGFSDLEAALAEIEERIDAFAKDPAMKPWTVAKFARTYNAIGSRTAGIDPNWRPKCKTG